MARKMKTAAEITKRDESPLRLTPEMAAFLNKMKTTADKAEERASRGGNGNAYYPIGALKKLERLGGKSEEQLQSWDLMRPEFKMMYPVGTQLIYLELKRIRRRVKAYKDLQEAKKKEATK